MAEPATVESNGTTPNDVQHTTEHTRARMTALWQSIEGALRRPAVGASVAGATVLAAGALCGITEAVLAGVAAWAIFRTLKKRSMTRGETESAPPSD